MKSKFEVPHVVLRDGEVVFEGSNYNKCWLYILHNQPEFPGIAMMYRGYKIEVKEAWHEKAGVSG